MSRQKPDNDIRHPDILVQIGKMVSSGMSYGSITEAIRKDWGINTSPAYVKRVFETYSARRTEVLQGDLELKSEIKQEILDWKDQLSKLNRITWNLIEDAKTGDFKLKALKEIRGQIELQNKILSRMEDSMTGQMINRIQITQDVIRTLEQLEKDGMIQILRRPGEVIDATAESYSVDLESDSNLKEDYDSDPIDTQDEEEEEKHE